MSKPYGFTIKITVDNRELIKKATDEQIKAALEAVGAQAASFAAQECTAKGVVDTGLLRNSLTFALGGGTADKRTYHASYGSGKYTTKTGETKRRSASSKKAGSVSFGRYEGTAPRDTMFDRKVYVGTNVEYAIYNELGTNSGAHPMRARPFLRPAIEHNTTKFQQIIERYLKRVVGK